MKTLSKKKIEQLKKLWFIYGNNGKRHSLKGHKFLQAFIENLPYRMKQAKCDTIEAYFKKMKCFYKASTSNEFYKDALKTIFGLKDYVVGVTNNKNASNQMAIKVSLYDEKLSFYDNCMRNGSNPITSKIITSKNKTDAKEKYFGR